MNHNNQQPGSADQIALDAANKIVGHFVENIPDWVMKARIQEAVSDAIAASRRTAGGGASFPRSGQNITVMATRSVSAGQAVQAASRVDAAVDRIIRAWSGSNANDHDIVQERKEARAALVQLATPVSPPDGAMPERPNGALHNAARESAPVARELDVEAERREFLAAEPNACWDTDRNRPAQEWANDRWIGWQASAACRVSQSTAESAPTCPHCDGEGYYEHKGATVACRVCSGSGIAESAPASAAPGEPKQLAHGHRDDFYLMANARRIGMMSIRQMANTTNWMLAHELFATGSNSAHQICVDAGIDPYGYKVECAPSNNSPVGAKEQDNA